MEHINPLVSSHCQTVHAALFGT